ncbi:unnamed protein product [Owenia fusiformis]|uniref:Single-stranded DNA binding protein Ssb-like OB fold domain-containing protein n=1 Tax=Owenia fusiformis TaxID=6347 RepID=A0A8S4P867_OWEFU|nr:unnamed protein product [Owenia fusiformis]
MGKPTRTKDGHDVRSCKVADKTGCINISLWDEAGDILQSGDILRLVKGYAAMWKGSLTLYTGKVGELNKIGEFCMQFSELPNFSEPNPEYMKLLEQQNKQRKSPTEDQGGQNGQNRPPHMGGPQGQQSSGNNSRPPRPMAPGGGQGGRPPMNGLQGLQQAVQMQQSNINMGNRGRGGRR